MYLTQEPFHPISNAWRLGAISRARQREVVYPSSNLTPPNLTFMERAQRRDIDSTSSGKLNFINHLISTISQIFCFLIYFISISPLKSSQLAMFPLTRSNIILFPFPNFFLHLYYNDAPHDSQSRWNRKWLAFLRISDTNRVCYITYQFPSLFLSPSRNPSSKMKQMSLRKKSWRRW